MEKRDWILAFLFAKGKTEEIGEPIDGSLRLMKNLFLLWIERNNLNLDNIYEDFKKYNYGPCDFNVYKDMKDLKEDKLIEEVDIGRSYSKLKLTKKGYERAEMIFNNMTRDIKEKIIEIKKEINSRDSLLSLLKFIYEKYPEWAENSLIKI
ncbi:hypothetical protein HYX17_04500 [Candidatus Woesearchaeota archaeon]|nr:hypothetical protein [Candidatus Woesearchaeota archaeon]